MKVVTFFNNKGGVGKTTTIINLASYLSIYREKKVLVVISEMWGDEKVLVIEG